MKSDVILRGGSWLNGFYYARVVYRDWNAPINYIGYYGFRLHRFLSPLAQIVERAGER